MAIDSTVFVAQGTQAQKSFKNLNKQYIWNSVVCMVDAMGVVDWSLWWNIKIFLSPLACPEFLYHNSISTTRNACYPLGVTHEGAVSFNVTHIGSCSILCTLTNICISFICNCVILWLCVWTSDIERFSDRYREKKVDGHLEWQPGNSMLIEMFIFKLYLSKECHFKNW